KMYMAHSVESRVPFLDFELVELLLGIPFQRLMAHGFRKYPLRVAMADSIGRDIAYDRAKIGFASPLQIDLARPAAREVLRPMFADARCARWVDPDQLASNYARACASGWVDRPLLGVIWLELWLRAFDL